MESAMTQEWSATAPARPRLHALAERIGRLEALDGPAEAVAKKVRGLLEPGPVKDALSGTWLGHALHPLLTDIPIGSWTSASILDLVGGDTSHEAAERLIAIGILSAVPTAVSGTNDWADTTPADDTVRRIGAVHALSNVAALGFYAASLTARRGGRRDRGVVLGMAGLAALIVGGHLGGHLSYDKAVGVRQTAFREHPDDWTEVAAEEAVREGELTQATVNDVDVLLVRHEGRLHALENRCTHRGGSLADGELSDGCVRCPLHGSLFRLVDGAVVRGPASAPQHSFDVRVRGGRIEVRTASAASGR